MPYADPEKRKQASRESARRYYGYKRGDRTTQFKDQFPNLEILSKLPEIERQVIEQYFGLNDEPMTLSAIATQLKVTRQYVGILKNQAIEKLQKFSQNL